MGATARILAACLSFTSTVTVTTNAVLAEEWPSRQIVVVSPFGVGTTTDIVDPDGALIRLDRK